MIKIKTIILFLFLSACGYQLASNVENSDIYIADYNLNGDKFVNRILGKNFSRNKNVTIKNKFNVNTFSEVVKTVNSKNKAGENVSLMVTVSIKFEILKNDDLIKVIELKDSNTYTSSQNKFEQKQYERVLIENMVENILVKFYQNLIEIE